MRTFCGLVLSGSENVTRKKVLILCTEQDSAIRFLCPSIVRKYSCKVGVQSWPPLNGRFVRCAAQTSHSTWRSCWTFANVAVIFDRYFEEIIICHTRTVMHFSGISCLSPASYPRVVNFRKLTSQEKILISPFAIFKKTI